jgi:hypothetical protein
MVDACSTPGRNQKTYKILIGNLEGRKLFESPRVDRIILKWILNKYKAL